MWVNVIEKNLIQPIDAKNLLIGEGWSAGCTAPHNETMAMDKKNGRLFVGCRPDFRRIVNPLGPRPDRIMVVHDANNGRMVTTVPIGTNPDQAGYDPVTGLVFSANGEGNVTVIKQETPDKYGVLETVPTEFGAARVAVDPKTHKIFVPNNEANPAGTAWSFRNPGAGNVRRTRGAGWISGVSRPAVRGEPTLVSHANTRSLVASAPRGYAPQRPSACGSTRVRTRQ